MSWVAWATRVGFLEEVIIVDWKVVEELKAQITLRCDVVFDLDKAVYFDMDGKTIWSELSRYFFVDLHEHVVGAFDDATLRFLLTHAVDKTKFFKRHLWDQVVKGAIVNFLCTRWDIVLHHFRVRLLRVAEV